MACLCFLKLCLILGKIMPRFIISLFIILALTWCSPRKPYHYEPIEKVIIEPSPSIVFLSFKISADTVSSKNNIELIKITTVPGSLKTVPDSNFTQNYLIISQLDSAHNLLKSIQQEHPLI